MLVIKKRAGQFSKADIEILLPFDVRKKSRFKAVSIDGQEVGVFLDRGTILAHGDCLESENGKIVRVLAQDESLLQITQGSAKSLSHLAYHLGNRHVSIEIHNACLRIADDEVLRDMVEGLGAHVHSVSAPFHPESGAYGGGHSHGPEHGKGRGPVIHDFAEE
ncbi:MAG: urease accessory protein UreE [Betaproteobacteria bacterium]|jgi:urease accessory protein|nr:urease accessory protein UreE [Betaproteobacteria bacterium]